MFDDTDVDMNFCAPCAGCWECVRSETAGAGRVGTDLTGVYRTDDFHC